MTRGSVPGKKHGRSWRSVLAGVLIGATAAAIPVGVGHGAARPHADAAAPAAPAAPAAIVLTGTSFPAGLGIDVASDPIGLQAALWSPIIGFDDKLAPYAALATRVPTLANGDARVIGGGFRVTVHLKPALRWSDGSPLTASDILFGLKLNLDPAIGNSFGLDEIAHIAAPDAHTVVLTFGDTYGAYLAYAMPPALPRAYFQRKYRSADIHALALAYRSDPYDSPSDVFSGPYRVASVAPGQRLTLDPNPYYTAPSGTMGSGSRPELRYVVLSEDESALARDLRSSQAGVDVALGLSPATLSQLGGLAGGLQARVLPSLAVEHLELNMATPALRDIHVRQALQDAIDKRAFVRALFPATVGASAPVATSLIPAVSPYHDGSIPVSRYDPARARGPCWPRPAMLPPPTTRAAT